MSFEWSDEWSATYSVGVPILDRQHRMLLAMCRDAAELLAGGTPDHARKYFRLLEAMEDYAKTHFETEERLLAEVGYAGLEAQRQEHAGYTQMIDQLRQKTARGELAYAEAHRFLTDWWLRHILESDMAYRSRFESAA